MINQNARKMTSLADGNYGDVRVAVSLSVSSGRLLLSLFILISTATGHIYLQLMKPRWLLGNCAHENIYIASHLTLKPLSPHDALKRHFTSLKTDLISLQQTVSEKKIPWSWLTKTWGFSSIFNHFKSSSFTTSRELRQQFAACSGWRWLW